MHKDNSTAFLGAHFIFSSIATKMCKGILDELGKLVLKYLQNGVWKIA